MDLQLNKVGAIIRVQNISLGSKVARVLQQ